MQDSFGRSIEYLRLSVTDRCNLRCCYCMPIMGICKKPHADVLRNEEYVSIVKTMTELGIAKVRITGGEPLVRKGLAPLAREIKNLKGIKDLSLTTNAILLESQAKQLKDAGINRVNISLDSLNSQTYSKLTGGGELSKVLRGIDKALSIGLCPVKINVVLIKGINDHEADDFLNYFDPSVEVRFIELMPIGQAANWSKDRFLNLSEFISKRNDLIPVPDHGHGGPGRYYKHTKTSRYVGIISAISNHFCTECNRIRVTSDGILKTCLHSAAEVNLKPFLNEPEILKNIIAQAISSKPASHNLNHNDTTPISRNMHTIGG